MKKILITQRLAEHDIYQEKREMLDVSWGKLLQKIGLIPVVLPYEYDFKTYFKEFKIQGIILTGGNDLNSLNKNNLSQQRDVLEKNLLHYAINHQIPIFGVCRGMQLIAEYFGSTFISVENQINITHTIKVNSNSRYANYLNSIQQVNSFHAYSIDTLAEDLLISATNDDSMIKAIEHKKYKIFAQMWHSERVENFNPAELTLIKEFFHD